jgi:hypothetical protein
MTELVFTAGERATLDLRDSSGQVTIKDWDGATIKVEAPATPYVLREQDTFRMRLPEGGTISLPIGLPTEVLSPDSVRVRVTRAGGETDVRAAPAATAGSERAAGARPAAGSSTDAPRDFTEFADVMADYGKRIVKDIARSVRASGSGVSDDVARKLEEAAERIDEKARQAAEKLQREVERTVASVERHQEHGRRAEEHARRVAERVAERVSRHAERHAERHAHRVERQTERAARRGRWWFTERWDEAGQSARAASDARRESTQAERLAIMEMLRDGKINADQAAKLLDALGG